MEKARRKEYSGAVLLRIRGFLHALRLVEMTVHFYHHNHGLPCISSRRGVYTHYPLRRSNIYPLLSFYPYKLLGLCFLIHSFNFLHCTTFSYTHLSLFHQSTKQFGNPTLCFLPHLPTLSPFYFYSLSFYLSLL